MTGDCHVRFCERLRGETPLCLLGEVKPKLRSLRISWLSLREKRIFEALGTVLR
jgi:hypothetical protein